MTPAGRYRSVTFRIAKVYRGSVGSEATIVTGLGTSDCGYPFEEGNRYLVYATLLDDGAFFTSICAGTSSFDQAAPAIRFLEGEKPSADDLLSIADYHNKFVPLWTGTVCGHITGPEGKPFPHAIVEMSEARQDSTPGKYAADEDLSTSDGAFCIKHAEPGKYLLTAQDSHVDEGYRYMGYYPGVTTHAAAVPVEIEAGKTISNVDFKLARQPLYLIRISVKTTDGTTFSPKDRLRVRVDSPDRDRLAYKIDSYVDDDGSRTFAGIPPGPHSVAAYFVPDEETGKYSAQGQRWRSMQHNIEIRGNTEVVMTLRLKSE